MNKNLYYFSSDQNFASKIFILKDGEFEVCSFNMTPKDAYTGKCEEVEIDVIYDNAVIYTASVYIGLKGDANGDGKITALDASLAFSDYKLTYNGKESQLNALQKFYADINGNEKLSASDASYIFSIYIEDYHGSD